MIRLVGVLAFLGVSTWAVAVYPRSVLAFLLFQGSLLTIYLARLPRHVAVALGALAVAGIMPKNLPSRVVRRKNKVIQFIQQQTKQRKDF